MFKYGKGLAASLALAAASALCALGCSTAQPPGSPPVLTEQDIGDIEFAADLVGEEACHAAADALNDAEVALMGASVEAAIATVDREGAASIQSALASVVGLSDRHKRRIAGAVDRLMARLPTDVDRNVVTRVIKAALRGCAAGVWSVA